MALSLADLPPDVIDQIIPCSYDRLIEVHESGSPLIWRKSDLDKEYAPDLLDFEGYHVLLPVGKHNNRYIKSLRCIVGDGGDYLTIFLCDSYLHVNYPKNYPDPEGWYLERVAICERVPGQDVYVTILYHQCSVNPSVFAQHVQQ